MNHKAISYEPKVAISTHLESQQTNKHNKQPHHKYESTSSQT